MPKKRLWIKKTNACDIKEGKREKKRKRRDEKTQRRERSCAKKLLLVDLLNHSDTAAKRVRSRQDLNLRGNFPIDVEFHNPIPDTN